MRRTRVRVLHVDRRDGGGRVILAGAVNAAGRRTLDQAQAAGWDGRPLILIGGHYHCSPPGKPRVEAIIDGTATAPSIVHRSFDPMDPSLGPRP